MIISDQYGWLCLFGRKSYRDAIAAFDDVGVCENLAMSTDDDTRTGKNLGILCNGDIGKKRTEQDQKGR